MRARGREGEREEALAVAVVGRQLRFLMRHMTRHCANVCECMCVRVSVRVSVSNCLSQSDKKALRDEDEAWLFWGL